MHRPGQSQLYKLILLISIISYILINYAYPTFQDTPHVSTKLF